MFVFHKTVAETVPDTWSGWNPCSSNYKETSWQMICLEPMLRNWYKKYWHMICLYHMLRSLHTEFLADDLSGTYVKSFTERALDRWYVWNKCEDLYTASHWHMIACNTCSDLHRERSWQMICLEPMWRLLQREFLTDDESGTYVEIFAQRVPDWHMFAFFCWKLVVNTKCHFLSVSIVSVTIP